MEEEANGGRERAAGKRRNGAWLSKRKRAEEGAVCDW